MSQQAGAHIHIGKWTNWSYGPIYGATFTLSERDGTLLSNFLALFVSAAGAAIWRSVSYIIHQCRAGPRLKDGLHHQQQAILRNTGSPGDASWRLIQIPFYWWDHTKRPLARSLPLAALALIYMVSIGLAGVFSGEVTKPAGNETLIRGNNCGTWQLNPGANLQEMVAMSMKILNDTITANTYASACYGKTLNAIQCSQYAQQNIPWTTNQNASCPFAPELCFFGPTSAYEMDTGQIDSHVVLGINAPPQDRVTYRKVTTCSVLRTANYSSMYNNTNVSRSAITYGDTYEQYGFGPIVNVTNYTYEYNLHTREDTNSYTLTPYFANAGDPDNSWVVDQALNRTDSDISIYFLSANNINYMGQVNDPLFNATIPNTILGITYYEASYYVRTLACTDQHQFCNPLKNSCTGLRGHTGATSEIPTLGMSPTQQQTAFRISGAALNIDTYANVIGRGPSALLASQLLYNMMSIPLPPTQWMTEVSNWFATGLAKLQLLTVQFATGPPYDVPGSSIISPGTDEEQKMCYNQKVRSASGTMSFSTLGVTIILAVGTLMIILNFVIDSLVGKIQARTSWGEGRRKAWVDDELLALQKEALEGRGWGPWEEGEHAVPLTVEWGKRMGRADGNARGSMGSLASTVVGGGEGGGKRGGGREEGKGRYRGKEMYSWSGGWSPVQHGDGMGVATREVVGTPEREGLIGDERMGYTVEGIDMTRL